MHTTPLGEGRAGSPAVEGAGTAPVWQRTAPGARRPPGKLPVPVPLPGPPPHGQCAPPLLRLLPHPDVAAARPPLLPASHLKQSTDTVFYIGNL